MNTDANNSPTAAALAGLGGLMMLPHETHEAWQARTGCATISDACNKLTAAMDAALAPKPCQHPRTTAGGTCLDCFARI